MMVCKKCGKELAGNARFCGGCGAAIKQDTSSVRNIYNKTNAGNVRNTDSIKKIKKVFSFVASFFIGILIIVVVVLFHTVLKLDPEESLERLRHLTGVNKDEEDADKSTASADLSGHYYIGMIQHSSFNQYPDTIIYDMFDVVFTDVEYAAYKRDSIPLVTIEGNHDNSHYVVTFMLIGDEKFKKKHGVHPAPFYSDEFYIASVMVDEEAILGDDFVNILSDFYDNQ